MLALHRPHNCQQAIMNVAGALQHLWMPLLQQSLIWLVLAKKQPPVMLLLMNGKTCFTCTQEPQGCHMTQDVEGDPLPSAEGYLSAFPTETWPPAGDSNQTIGYAAEQRVANRSFAVPGIERCPVRTVANIFVILVWHNCSWPQGPFHKCFSPRKGLTRLLVPGLGAAPWQAGLRWFRRLLASVY